MICYCLFEISKVFPEKTVLSAYPKNLYTIEHYWCLYTCASYPYHVQKCNLNLWADLAFALIMSQMVPHIFSLEDEASMVSKKNFPFLFSRSDDSFLFHLSIINVLGPIGGVGVSDVNIISYSHYRVST